IGGILGKVVKTKDDVLTIQVGADKTKFEVMRWAISKVNSDEPASSSRKSRREEPVEEPEQEAPKKTLPKRMRRADESPESEIAETEAAEVAEESENKE
ncbi:MAG TPA: hypothetical protein VN381_09840, partial [Anaerovoracaceae bacterium]|nr:hypothetical protein [Anaerovoracaceae bacterium]